MDLVSLAFGQNPEFHCKSISYRCFLAGAETAFTKEISAPAIHSHSNYHAEQ